MWGRYRYSEATWTLVSKNQYSLSKEGKKGLQPVVELKAGLLKLCMSPCNTPILPVMVQDLRVGY